MSEKLTKTSIKNEFKRRIEWFEKHYGFSCNTIIPDTENNKYLLLAYNKYLCLVLIKYQIENNLFIDGAI